MKNRFPIILLLFLLAGCTTRPLSVRSRFFESKVAGLSWSHDGSASSIVGMAIQGTAPEIMFVEAILPNPMNPSKPVVLRKRISKRENQLFFEGPPLRGWVDKMRYTYLFQIYADAKYTQLIGTHRQVMTALRPPGV